MGLAASYVGATWVTIKIKNYIFGYQMGTGNGVRKKFISYNEGGDKMTIYIVQYHDNSWGAQESEDEILGVYSSEEAATKRVNEFQKRIAKDDYLFVNECELDEDIPSYDEYMESQCE